MRLGRWTEADAALDALARDFPAREPWRAELQRARLLDAHLGRPAEAEALLARLARGGGEGAVAGGVADSLADGEQLELLAEDAMIATFGFFELCEMGVEFFLIEECGRVEALQLLVVGIALPIRAGHGEQLERRADEAGAGDVPAAAQIDEFALPIEREVRLVGQAGLDVLDFEILLQLLAQIERFAARHIQPFEFFVGFDDLLHLGFDLGEILLGDRAGQGEVVIEAGRGRRAEGELHAFEQPHHGLGHHVGRAVPHDGQCFRVFLGEQPQLDFAAVGKLLANCAAGRRLPREWQPSQAQGQSRPLRRRRKRAGRIVSDFRRAE